MGKDYNRYSGDLGTDLVGNTNSPGILAIASIEWGAMLHDQTVKEGITNWSESRQTGVNITSDQVSDKKIVHSEHNS